MMLNRQNNNSVWLCALVILVTRIPFIFSGYGSEEDAWGLILIARNIDLTGVYEVSRMPGHPAQELLLSGIWQLPPWVLNLLTAIISTAGIFFFMLTLRLWGIRNYLWAGLMMAFIPVFYINSSNIMDYTWALALVMAAMYQLAKGNMLLTGILLGIACGFRITAGAMVIPFAVYLFYQPDSLKKIIVVGSVTTLTALICFIPAFNVYGQGFFTYYEYFPYPPFLKNVYKATIGAWGLPGTLVIVTAIIWSTYKWMKSESSEKKKILPLVLMSLTAILLYSYSFLRIPQKSAFVIPMIPFIVIIFSLLLSRKQVIFVTVIMAGSCFLFGVNLDDKFRGSTVSPLALKIKIANTPVAIDPLIGMVTADHFKRNQKIAYAKQLVEEFSKIDVKTIIIAGWWQNELKYFSLNNENPQVKYVYYEDESVLKSHLENGHIIYFLPEQDFYNDLRFNKKFTNVLAKLWDQP